MKRERQAERPVRRASGHKSNRLTSLKTLTMFLRASKTDLQALGEDAEGCADSVSKLREELKGLTGVDIMKNNKEYKSTFDIIKEISAVWQELDDVTQANVANLLGGKRNANVIQALMTNFKDAEAAMQTASNAAGSALKENEQYLDSIQGKLDIMKGKFQELAMQIVGSDLVKWAADVGNGTLDIVNGLQRAHALLPLVVGAVTAIVLSVAKLKAMAGETNILAMLGGGIGSMGPLAAGIMGVAAAAAALIGVINHFSQAQQRAIDQAQQVTEAYAESEAEYSRNIATLDSLSERYHELANKTELTAEEQQEYKNILQQIVDISPTVAAGYDKEHNAIVGYKDAVVAARDELEKLHLEQQKEYFSKTEKTWGGYQADLEKARGSFRDIAIETLSGLFYQIENVASTKFGVGEARDALLKAVSDIFGAPFKDDSLLAGLDFADWLTTLTDQQLMEFAERSDDYVARIKQLNLDFGIVFGQELMNSWDENVVDTLWSAASKMEDPLDSMSQYMEDWLDYQDNKGAEWAKDISSQPWYEELLNAIPNLIDESSAFASQVNIQNYVAGLRELGSSAPIQELYDMAAAFKQNKVSAEEFGAAIDEYEKSFNSYNYPFAWNEEAQDFLPVIPDGVESYIRDLRNILTGAEDASEEVDNVTNSVVDLSTAVDKFTSGQKILETAKEEMKAGGLSVETIKSINDSLAEGEKLSDYLRTENGLIKLNTEAWDERSRSIIDSNISALKDEIAGYDAQILEATGGIANNPFVSGEVEQIQEARAEAQTLLDVLTAIATGTNIEDIDKQIADIDSKLYEMKEGAFHELADPKDIAALEQEKERLEGVRDTLAEIEDASEEVTNPLSDAMEKASKYADAFKSSIDGIDFDEWKQLRDIFGDKMDEYLNTDGTLNKAKMYKEVLDDLVASGASRQEIRAFQEMWFAITGEEHVDTAKDNIETIISSVQELSSVTQTLREMDSGDIGVIDVFEKLLDLAKDNENIDLSSVLGADGTINMDAARDTLQSYADSLFTLDELQKVFPDITQAQADALREQILAYKEAEEAATSFADSLSNISSASDLLKTMRSDESDFLSTLESVSKFTSEHGIEGQMFEIINGEVDWSNGINAVKDWASTYIDSMEGIDDATKKMLQGYLEAQQEIISKSEWINKMRSDSLGLISLGEGAGAQQITYDSYNQLLEQSSQYAYALEYVNGALTINREKFDEVTNSILQSNLAEIEAKQQAILLSKEYQDLCKNVGNLGDEQQKRLDDLNAEIMGYEVLASEINHATSAFQKFLGLNSSAEGDNYGIAKQMAEMIQNVVYNKESDLFGQRNNEAYKYSVEMLIGADIQPDTPEWEAGWAAVEKYINAGKEGLSQFMQDAWANGLVDETGVVIDSVEAWAEKLGTSTHVVEAMIDQWNKIEPIKITQGGPLDTSGVEDGAKSVNVLIDAFDNLKNAAKSKVEAAKEKLLEMKKAAGDAGTEADDLSNQQVTIDTSPAIKALGALSTTLTNIMNRLNKLANKVVNVTVNYKRTGYTGGMTGVTDVSGTGWSAAPGMFGAPGGRTLVGELGRKLFCVGIW